MRVPQELLRSTPRHVALTATGKAVAWIAVCLLAAGLVTSATLLALARRGDAREREALDAPGRIVALTSTRGENPQLIATYVYVVGEHTYEGSGRVGRNRQQLGIGDSILVRYLPSDHLTSWVDGYGPGNVPVWVSPLVFLSLVSGGVGLLVSVRRQTHLLSYGRATTATVTTWRKAGKGARRVGFRYDVLSGATHTSSIEIQKNAPPPGSEMIVVYDPDNPRRRARYPLELVRCVAPY